ncbi:hypothetical protein H2200_007069 [Cladophialophora chaetospira]|uniref:Heterokaryon incompatibility domain-containing protein n=1 Tax=Cladophialophora chaetospira TaxID=386627 RepID=A0AA39CGR9_9EURO|nr:hypothetical protein H2200_007069 [Cladophialophora chaetospira]
MPLCERCSSISLVSLLSQEMIPHHESYAALQISARTCETCHVISLHLQPNFAKAIDQNSVHHNLKPDSDKWVTLLEECATPISLRYRIPYDIGVSNGEPRKVNRNPVRRSWLDVRCGKALPQVSDNLSSSSSKLEDLDLIAYVDVFVYEGKGGMLRVIDVQPSTHYEYVALSYCWGAKHKTWISYVKCCQAADQRIIAMQQMPKTLKDAVTCCLKLGYTHLWIDCLCILQGNKADWLQEGAKMCDIYANSALTISASDSKDCRDGFLVQRTALSRNGAVLNLLDDRKDIASHLHLELPGRDFQSLVGGGPVAKRGWCLQERQLCPRLLHVCQNEVFFECIRCRRFESEVAPDEEFDLNNEHHAYHMPKGAYGTERGKPSPAAQTIFSWYSIMQDYTRRGLAVSDDKLVAIAGLAKRAQRVFGEEYLAGLWMRQIHVGLLWMIDDDVSASRASVYRAPSWSWASMDGPVSWSLIDGFVQTADGFIESAIEVVNFLVQPDGKDPFGPVQKVEMFVKGRLKCIPASELLANKVLTYPEWMSGRASQIGCYLEDEKRVIAGERIPCMKVANRPFGPGPSLPPTNEVIVLQKVQEFRSDGLDTYRRIAFGQVLVTNYFDDCVASTIRLI